MATEALRGEMGWSTFQERIDKTKINYRVRLEHMNDKRWAEKIFEWRGNKSTFRKETNRNKKRIDMKIVNNETGSRSPCSLCDRDRSPEDEKLYAGQNCGGKKNNEANWMVSNSAKLDRRTKQHTQFGVSASNGSRDMAQTKSWQKKNNEANWMVSNSAKLDCRTKQHTQFGVSASNG